MGRWAQLGRTEEPGLPSGEKWVAQDWLQLMWCVEFMLFGLAESASLINKIMTESTTQRINLQSAPDQAPAFQRKYCILVLFSAKVNGLYLFVYNSSIVIKKMLFDIDEAEHRPQNTVRIVYLYENGRPDHKPLELRLFRKKNSFREIAKMLKFSTLRLFNSDGAECFEEDLDFIKHKSVLYASKGEEFDPGSCFAEYQMLRLLGEGGFGKVFLARHKQSGEQFAIKVIKTENIGSAADIDAIFVEAEVLRSLNHPNIVKVHKCLTLRNMEVVIIMEYLQGGELLKYVQSAGRLDQTAARGFLRQIAKGMLYCHQSNLTHRDLKLQNLLLVNSEESKIKIIDFGIAGAISTLKWEDLDTGSLAYMAPQCFINSKNQKFDGRLDVWSTGVILYGMLVGQLPFKGSSCHETIESIKSGKYKIPSAIANDLSPECISVLKRCLDVNPKTRITMQQLCDHPWLSTTFNPPKRTSQQLQPVIEQKQKEVKLKQVGNIDKPKAPLPLNHKNSFSKLNSNAPSRIKFVQPEKQSLREKRRFK